LNRAATTAMRRSRAARPPSMIRGLSVDTVGIPGKEA
jgi:hypothetical protein